MCHKQSWTQALPLIMLGLRVAIKEDLGTSPADSLKTSQIKAHNHHQLLTLNNQSDNTPRVLEENHCQHLMLPQIFLTLKLVVKVHYNMSLRPLSEELQDLAINELNEDPKRIPDDIEHLKNWLSKQHHLRTRTDDQFLVTFLRGCKFSLERSKEKLDMHYTLKTVTPEIYKDRDPFRPEIQKVLSVGPMLPLPKLAHSAGPRYILARNSLIAKHDLDQAAAFKVSAMIQDILLLEDDNLAIAGTSLLHDMSDLSMTHILSTVSPSLIKKIMTCVQYGYPNRIKAAVFFNVTPVFETIHKIFRPFLTEKLRNRLHICKSSNDFMQAVPKEVIPEEYGGAGGKLDDIAKYWKTKVESYRDWFLEDAKYGTDEKKRPGKPKTSESIYGIDGSFRQLAVD